MAHFLNAVFSFNRGELLDNCVQSIRRFYPESRIVVFDDNSDEAETLRVLDRIGKTDCQVIRSDPAQRLIYGNLYGNMNRALAIAADQGCEFVHFMQDDTQVVWRRPDLLEHVAGIFHGNANAYQLQVHFVKRLGRSEADPLDGPRAYKFRTPGGDLGFFHVRRILERQLEFGPRERIWAARAAALGLEAHATADPVVARVPWARNSRFRRSRGRAIDAQHELLVRPLDATAVARLTSRSLADRPWGEDWIVPWGWRCWQPYPADPSVAKWLKTLLGTALRRRSLRGLLPRRVGELDGAVTSSRTTKAVG